MLSNAIRAIILCAAVPLMLAAFPSVVWAQRKVVSKPATQKAGSAKSAISQDLQDVYSQTGLAVSADDYTKIARFCADVIQSPQRSKADRDYAKNLLAWSLNRRGEVRGDEASQLVEEGKIAQAEKLDQQAAEDFATAIQYAPNNWRTVHNYAISLAMQGKYALAIEQFSQVVSLNDQYANAFFNRGELYFETKKYSLAVDDYSQAIALVPSDAQYFNSRGHSQFMLSRYEPALEDYRQAVKLGADSAVYHTDLADALQFLGQWDEAARQYREAIALNANYGRAYKNAAWLMATCPDAKYRDTELALSAARKAHAMDGDGDFRTLDTLAAAMAATGDTRQAVKVAEQAMQTAPVADRPELMARMKLYQQGRAYVQPRVPVKIVDESTAEPAEPSVVTASNSKRPLPRQR